MADGNAVGCGEYCSELADATRIRKVFDNPQLVVTILNSEGMFDDLAGRNGPADHRPDARCHEWPLCLLASSSQQFAEQSIPADGG